MRIVQVQPRAIVEFERNLKVKAIHAIADTIEEAERIETLLKKAFKIAEEEE